MTGSPPPPAAIAWHQRLEARVLVGVTLLAGVAMAGVLAATSQVVTAYSLDRSGHDVLAARAAFTRLVAARVQFASKETRLVAELPTFVRELTDPGVKADTPTIDALAEDYCNKLDAQFCVVTDQQGLWIGRAKSPHPDTVAAINALVTAARGGQPRHEILSVGDKLFLVVSEPALFATEVLGTFTAGYHLDDREAKELAIAARCDVGFVCAGSRLCGSSLPPANRAALAALVSHEGAGDTAMTATPALRQIGADAYVGGEFALGSGANPNARLVLLEDWSPSARALGDLHRALLWVGVLAFGVAMGAALVFSRRISRPLRDLAKTAGDIASGAWSRRLPVAGSAEARIMAESFNHMTHTLSEAHDQVQNQSRKLQDAYARFRAVSDSVNDAIVSVNTHGEIVFWNRRAQVVFGCDEHEALGESIDRFVPARHLAEHAAEIRRLREGATLGQTIELSGLRHDGTEVPIELSLSTWTADGEIFYTGVVRDITERRQAADALREREDQLRHAQKMEAVGRLAGGIAHDFNNLLTAILGYADLLLEELPADNPIRIDIAGIQKAGRSAASLTKELLAFSRKQVLQPVVLNLNDVARGAEHLLRCMAGAHAEFILELDPDLQSVMGDRGQVEQVLLNLVVNARDAMPPSGGHLTIKTANVTFDADGPERRIPGLSGRHVVLTLSDTGHGMTEEVRSHIFEPFFTTKELGKGTGLGLATVYGIVKQSGGYIWVESAPGEGATFSVCLPAVDAVAEPSGEPDAGPDELARFGTETVLLVEDNESVRELTREALARAGYQVLEARDGAEGLRLAAARLGDIAVVVTDVVMPIMGGREMAARLSALRPDLRVIFMSGYANESAASPSGAGEVFLKKPFMPADLARAVRDVLDRPSSDMVLPSC